MAGAGSGLQNRAGLHKYDAATGRLLQTGDFVDGSADPHGLLMRDGVLYSCDAGVPPGAPLRSSPASGCVFRIEFV